MSWNAGGDFDEVVDTLEPLTLFRRGGDAAGENLRAWRYRDERSTPHGPEGGLSVVDATWQLPLSPTGEPPRPGDTLRPDSGPDATIREVDHRSGETRVVCIARSVELTPLQEDRFVLERPLYGDEQAPSVITGWRVVRPSVAAWIDRQKLDSAPEKTTEEVTLATAYFAQPLAIRREDRLRSDRSGTFLVESVVGQAGLGDPFVVQLESAE